MTTKSNSSFAGIPLEHYEEFEKVCFSNSLDILDDAKILFDREKYARSFALCVMAAEELNKALFFKLVSAGVMSLDVGFESPCI